MRVRRIAVALAAALAAGCAGGGEGSALTPFGNVGAGTGSAGSGNMVVKIYVPAGSLPATPVGRPPPITPVTPVAPGINAAGGTAPTQAPAPTATAPSSPGSQALAISMSGPVTINQTVSVGPSSSGCSPVSGGTSCQLALTLPSGTYSGTIGSSGVAFTVAPSSTNSLNLTMGGTPSQVAVVPASSMSAANAQGGIDLYGAGKHLVIVELLDANQNVMVGGSGATFGLSQAGGALAVAVAQAAGVAPNLFYVTAPATPNANSAILRATANYVGPANPCAQSGSVCSGTTRVDERQILGVANSGANSVTLYVNGQSTPLTTILNGVTNPQALLFDAGGDLFVANQPGTVTAYTPPYAQPPISIANGINHPQALALDSRGDLFVANGNGSNTVTVYSAPYTGAPTTTISSNVNDPVSLALDATADLFVVNSAANTVTEYAPPYTGVPTTISKGLSTPGSLAIDTRGNLFVANLNSTPNSVVEYSPPFSSQSMPVATISNGINEQGSIALTATNLFVPNQGANTVTEYTAPYTAPPTTIVGGQSQPVALAVDALGNLYVANYGNNSVTVYPAPYAGGSWTTLNNGISAPMALALSPPTTGGPTLLP
jgi:NHL repeat